MNNDSIIYMASIITLINNELIMYNPSINQYRNNYLGTYMIVETCNKGTNKKIQKK